MECHFRFSRSGGLDDRQHRGTVMPRLDGLHRQCWRYGSNMRLNARRLGLLFAAGFLITVAVVACATPQPTTPSSYNSSSSSNNVFHTPNASLNSPTPTFPTFTVGTWPSNYSPNNNDTLTIYVICRKQDPTMQTPPTPAAGVTILLQFNPQAQAAVNLAPLTATTGPDGIAAFTFQLNDPTSGVPIQVLATATYQGFPYTAQTFFTPNPEAKPSPSPCASPSGGPGNGNGGGPPANCNGGGNNGP
jgi:hypothetical protein